MAIMSVYSIHSFIHSFIHVCDVADVNCERHQTISIRMIVSIAFPFAHDTQRGVASSSHSISNKNKNNIHSANRNRNHSQTKQTNFSPRVAAQQCVCFYSVCVNFSFFSLLCSILFSCYLCSFR